MRVALLFSVIDSGAINSDARHMKPERRRQILGYLILVMGIVAATVVALGLHIAADPPIQEWVGRQMQGRTLNHTGALVGTMAFATALIDVSAIALLQTLVYSRLPGWRGGETTH